VSEGGREERGECERDLDRQGGGAQNTFRPAVPGHAETMPGLLRAGGQASSVLQHASDVCPETKSIYWYSVQTFVTSERGFIGTQLSNIYTGPARRFRSLSRCWALRSCPRNLI
jgi:hypothetical protein